MSLRRGRSALQGLSAQIGANVPNPKSKIQNPKPKSEETLREKKLGLLLTSSPERPAFRHAVKLAEAALAAGVKVYAYCIDDAVLGVQDAGLQSLRSRGLNLYACAYAAQRRRLPATDAAVFAGLTVVSDIISATDRFVTFG